METSPDLAKYLLLLASYCAVAGGIFFWIWRAFRARIASVGLRLALRAAVLALLFAPAGVSCGSASILPFALLLMATSVGLISTNVCGALTASVFLSILLTYLVAAIALYILDRHRHRGMPPDKS